MKYNEAIDMILDGGVADSKSDSVNRLYFGENILYGGQYDGLHLTKADTTILDWVVKKDGVVYEEYCTIDESHKEHVSILKGALKAADEAISEQPAPIQIDEDWLEKKICCVIKRVNNLKFSGFATLDKVSCRKPDCPFCFPEEKDDHIPEVSKMVEEPREKVTVEDIEKIVDHYYDALSVYHNVLGCCDAMKITEKQTLMRLAKHYLMREIKYLVSLQEKK
mgnify:CR=1 FL=1